MNWYIGQDIVCIKTHSRGVVKEGEVYVIKALKKECCLITMDIGVRSEIHGYINCPICNRKIFDGEIIWWVSERLFAPLDTLTNISEIEEILNKPIETLFKTN